MAVKFTDILPIVGGAAAGLVSPRVGPAFMQGVSAWKQAAKSAENDAQAAIDQERADIRWAHTQGQWARQKARDQDYEEDRIRQKEVQARRDQEWKEGREAAREDEEEEEKQKAYAKEVGDTLRTHSRWNDYLRQFPTADSRLKVEPRKTNDHFRAWLSADSKAKREQAENTAEEMQYMDAFNQILSTPEGQQWAKENAYVMSLGPKATVEGFTAWKKSKQGKTTTKEKTPAQMEGEYTAKRGKLIEQKNKLITEMEDALGDEASAQIKKDAGTYNYDLAARYEAQIANIERQIELLDEEWTTTARTPWSPPKDGAEADPEYEAKKNAARATAGL